METALDIAAAASSENIAAAAPRDREPLGLLAGAGHFPIHVASKARQRGWHVVCLGIRGAADPALAEVADRLLWTGLKQFGKMVRLFRAHGVRKWTMAGKVNKARGFNAKWRVLTEPPDWRFLRFWFGRRHRDNRDDSFLLDFIANLNDGGLECMSALEICPQLLVGPGILTNRRPTPSEWKDVKFGWNIAREMGRLDVGQSVMVREQAVLAVEAMEGTDQAIQRAGQLCPRGGFVVVKVAKPKQDMRFDVPTVGPSTIENMIRSGAKVLAIEASRSILLQEEQTIGMANRHGLSILSLSAEIDCDYSSGNL
ncbi:MAG TPA: UDP-2,3-diacylglucosamine diphosphatase LpxI [Gemmataceae bacterium]|nr:UDP-2,3-diacylglucosamine diphosphatase LpxI [Gemmataceae bacterium]